MQKSLNRCWGFFVFAWFYRIALITLKEILSQIQMTNLQTNTLKLQTQMHIVQKTNTSLYC